QLARKHNADLFVSIHADAFTRPEASGASVYAISERGATSETARWLAERENRSDLIGGVGGVSLDDKDNTLAGVLLDLSMTASLNASLSVGNQVLRSMGTIAKLHKPRWNRRLLWSSNHQIFHRCWWRPGLFPTRVRRGCWPIWN